MTDLPNEALLEEETLPGYRPQNYYPIKFKDVINDKYRIHAKLGFDAESTSWLVMKLDADDLEFLLLQVFIANKPLLKANGVFDKIRAWDDFHIGLRSIHSPIDHFMLTSAEGQHPCYVYNLCGSTLQEHLETARQTSTAKGASSSSRVLVLQICWAATVLHKLGVVHTNINSDQILLRYIEPFSIGASLDIENAFDARRRKAVGERMVYESLDLPAQYGYVEHAGDVMLLRGKAPEVILGLQWDHAVDLWSIGLLVWEMFQEDSLFSVDDALTDQDEHVLAQMVSLIGSPSKDLVQRSTKAAQYWDEEGRWIAKTRIPDQTLETRLTKLDGEDKNMLLELLRKMLRWSPEDRVSAENLWMYDRFMNPEEADDDMEDEVDGEDDLVQYNKVIGGSKEEDR